MGAVVVHVLILWAAIGVGFGVAWLHRRTRNEAKSGEFGASLSFIASMFGLLLGLLVVTATNHYSDTRKAAQTEATTIVALFGDVSDLPVAVREPVQHQVVCYARSVAGGDWRQMDRGSDVEAASTRASGDALRASIARLPEGGAASAASGKLTEAGAARQQLLFLARSSIPIVLWVLIYLGAAVLMFLIASDMASGRSVAIAGLACVVLMLTVVVGVLVTLDRPFSPLARVEPTALRAGLDLIAAGRENAAFLAPCSR
jgi:hypothetical protein